jgi:hypothetical protein
MALATRERRSGGTRLQCHKRFGRLLTMRNRAEPHATEERPGRMVLVSKAQEQTRNLSVPNPYARKGRNAPESLNSYRAYIRHLSVSRLHCHVMREGGLVVSNTADIDTVQ